MDVSAVCDQFNTGQYELVAAIARKIVRLQISLVISGTEKPIHYAASKDVASCTA